MFQYSCLNPIAQIGLDGFDGQYEKTDDVNAADVVLVRSAAMHDMELSDKLCAIARACWPLPVPVPVSTIFHWINVRIRVSLYLTHRVQMLTV